MPNDSLRLSVARVQNLAREFKEKARNEAFDHRVRAAYADAGAAVSTAAAELDYIMNMKG